MLWRHTVGLGVSRRRIGEENRRAGIGDLIVATCDLIVDRWMASMASKFEVTRFDGTGNFGLWQTRVKDLLAQQGILKTLSDVKPIKVDDDKWDEMKAQASATIRMCVS